MAVMVISADTLVVAWTADHLFIVLAFKELFEYRSHQGWFWGFDVSILKVRFTSTRSYR
jgi:hypothetical protein